MSTAAKRQHLFSCHLVWTGATPEGTSAYDKYSRDYRVDFEGKPPMFGSAAPTFRGDPALHNPEDLLVASLSACHCLSYLALCAVGGLRVIAYEDDATGTLERIDRVMRFSEVVLRPKVTLAPGSDLHKARALHEKAHAECFIANSVSFPVRNEPTVVEG